MYSLFPDPLVRIPLTWPRGTYGLPMPQTGCPTVPGFTWHQGTRYQDTENYGSGNRWSTTYHLAGRKAANDMEQRFCMKTQELTNKYDLLWPNGQYCVFKKGKCPQGTIIVLWDPSFESTNEMHPSCAGAISRKLPLSQLHVEYSEKSLATIIPKALSPLTEHCFGKCESVAVLN